MQGIKQQHIQTPPWSAMRLVALSSLTPECACMRHPEWMPPPMEVPPASESMSVEPQVMCSLDRAIVGTDRPRSRRDLGRSRNRSCWGDESGHGAWVSAACKAVEGVQIDHKNDLRPPSTAIHAHGERALIPFFDLPRHIDVAGDIIVSCGQGEDYE